MKERVLDLIPHLIVICDGAGIILQANKKWEEYSGLTEYEPYPAWLDVVHPNEIAFTRDRYAQFVAGGAPYDVKHRLRSVTGEYRWFHSIALFYDSKPSGDRYVVTSTDIHTEITLRNSCIEQAKREDVYLRRMMHSSDPVITINASDGTIISSNHSIQTYLQYSPSELIGKPITILMSEKTASRHMGPHGYLSKFNKSKKLGHQTAIGTNNQIQAKCKDGTFLPITLIVDSYIKSGFQIFVAVLRPINREIHIQHLLNKSKDEFLSTMSHELRTPLFGLLGTISLLHSRALDTGFKQDLTYMEASTTSLLAIVNNMIDFYLLKHLHTSPTNIPFNIEKLVQDVCGRMSAFSNEGVFFNFTVHNTPETIISDPNFIEHILVNLISNALRFTNDGQVSVEVSRLDNLQQDSELVQLQIAVKDTGIGIPPEFYPQLFQPFCQADSSDSRNYKGVGLGLAMVNKIVKLLGGSISFKSSQGHGSEFTVVITVKETHEPAHNIALHPLNSPLIGGSSLEQSTQMPSPPPRDFPIPLSPVGVDISKEIKGCPVLVGASSPREKERSPKPPRVSKCVLIVEDNQMNQLIVKRMLEKFNCKVVIANHGCEALKMLFDKSHEGYVGYNKIDCILVDCQMPIMNGYQLTEHVRGWESIQENHPHKIILAISASISSEIEARCLKSGMDGFIAKPVTATMLYHHIMSFHEMS